MISFYKNESGVVMYRDDSYLHAEKFTVERPATAFDLAAHPTEYAAFTAVGQTLTAAYPSGTIGTIQFTRTLVALPFTKTLISGAVANSVSSLSYQLTSADSGYNVGVDFSNQVSSGSGTAPSVGTLRQVATGTFLSDTIVSTNKYIGTRSPHLAAVPITTLQVSMLNWYVAGSVTETNSTDVMNGYMAIEYPAGTKTACTFGGAAMGTAAAGGELLTDALPITIPQGAKFWVWMYLYMPSGVICCQHYTSDGTAQLQASNGSPAVPNYAVSGAVSSNYNTVPTGKNQYMTVPSAIIANSNVEATALVGDSISVGTNDTADTNAPFQGHLGRAFKGLPYGHLGTHGDRLTAFNAGSSKRVAFAKKYFTRVACHFGINDVTSGRTAQQVQDDTNTMAALYSPMKVGLCTLAPTTTSTDTWATVANQTIAATASVRVAVNNQRKTPATLAANIVAVWDVVPAIENTASPEDSLWKAGQYTKDGTHPENIGYVAMAALIDAAAFVAAQTTPVAPNAPTVLATKGPASATLVITPGAAGSTAATGYTVTLPANAVDADNGSTKLTRTITGLTPFTSQTFSVVANSASGNSSAGVSNSVAADRVDTTAPTFVAGTITGNTVRLTYSEALTGGSIDASQFALVLNGAAAVAPSALSQFGSLLVLTFPSTAAIGDTATISYTQGAAATAVRDLSNNLTANLSAQSITNNTAAVTTNVFGANRIRANDSYVTGSSGIATHHYKFEAEADFIGIRIGYIEHNTSGTMPNLEFLYGVTDTGAYDTVMHEYVPTSNGVSKNTMAASASEVAWHRGTWNGGNNIGVPSPSAQASYAGNVTWSDLMPCASIPRTDVVGGRPMLVLRVANTLSGAVWTQGPANANYNNGRGQPFYREMLSYKTTNDAVNNLGNLPGGTNNNFQNEMAIFVEFQYANPIRNVILTGDSRNSSAFNSYITSWQLVALRQAIGATGKIGVVNCTGSGHNQVQFLKLVNDFLDSGGHATDLIIPAFSQNGYTNAATYASNMQATLDRCTAAGINIWMDTDYSVDGYTTQDAQRQTSLSNARTMLAQGKIKGLIDIDSLVTDYGPQYPIFKAGLTLDGTSFPGDKIHVSSAAQNSLLQPMLTKVWQ